jgi:hypothetical protein
MTHDGYRQRLYDAAEAFYFAGILTSLPFNAASNSEQHCDVSSAADAAINGENRLNQLGAPPIVNFGFSIELYIKLLRYLTDALRAHGHDLRGLFLELEKAAPSVASLVIEKHHYARGDRCEFLDYLRVEARVFEQWRYAYEQESLCSSADALFMLANAFRNAIRDLYPDMVSAFVHPERQD